MLLDQANGSIGQEQPDIASLHQEMRNMRVVVLYEDDPAAKGRIDGAVSTGVANAYRREPSGKHDLNRGLLSAESMPASRSESCRIRWGPLVVGKARCKPNDERTWIE
jgi:hypothetical protein